MEKNGMWREKKKAISIIPWLATQKSHYMLPRKKKKGMHNWANALDY